MQLATLINFLNDLAPQEYQESYDNSGLLIGSPSMKISSVLICLDAVESVVDEAIKRKCNVIVAHHPIIFSGLKSITGANYIERTILKAIRHHIAIFAIHTNLDNMFANGVNTKICEKIGLTNTKIMSPKYKEISTVGAGMIGDLPAPVDAMQFLLSLKHEMKVDTIRHTNLINKTIHKIAVCGGAGSFLLSAAKAQNADLYISADFKYHEFFDADNEIVIADIGHYESEQFTIDLLQEKIVNQFSEWDTYKTLVNTNPVNYL